MSLPIDKQSIRKFDVQGPRYTSYPTAPEWSAQVNESVYRQTLAQFGQSSKTLSVYIHIPFCEQLCYFCACMKVIRKNEERHGDEYLKALFQEIEMTAQAIGARKRVRQFHWGGGTPTYLSEEQIRRLFEHAQKYFDIDLDGEISIEIDPRTVKFSKLKLLRALGFNRVSMGVQDFDPEVHALINRPQSFALVKEVTDFCRELKFDSLNFDLIYGLPKQTPKSFTQTVGQVISLRPDRIALYSFAYVPWLQKHQTKMEEGLLPTSDDKLDIFVGAREAFLANGYEAIAMDHFALESDEMARAFNAGKLYRNFMGYTVKPADEYIGFGVSAIGFLEKTFFQNIKVLPDYYEAIVQGGLPIERGKVLTHDDQIRQWVITQLMCHFKIDKTVFERSFGVSFNEYFAFEQEHLTQCVEDRLLNLENTCIEVTEFGRIFIRNICMGFDWYLRQKSGHRRFSRTV